MSKHVHLISFDVPYPPNYGGIIDVFYKVRALYEIGIQITLHCFFYEGHNPPNPFLNKYCSQVFYYKRKKNTFGALFGRTPHIVASRSDKELLKRLLEDESPIFYEGLHTCHTLNAPSLKNRIKMVRAHNIEHNYYHEIADSDKGWRKIYHLKEAKRLENFERILKHATCVFSIAKEDQKYFENYTNTEYLPAFYCDDEIQIIPPTLCEPFVLFHGNLAVKENELAALYIADLLKESSAKLIIAGKEPSAHFEQQLARFSNAALVGSPSKTELDKLLQHAQVNVMVGFRPAGVKLKILHALQIGQHVVINDVLNDGNAFSNLCKVVKKEELGAMIAECMQLPFLPEDRSQRLMVMKERFNNRKGAQRIANFISA